MAVLKNKSSPPDVLTAQNLQGGLTSFLDLEWLEGEPELGQGKRADARIRLTHQGKSKTFIVEYKKLWTAAALSGAIAQVKLYARLSPDDLPLVVVPYLNDDQLQTLLEAGVSGLDLVGNGVLTADPWLLMFSRGQNAFKNPQPVKSPYSGKSALVARTLLACPVLPTAEALRAETQQRGGSVSQPVISRALKAFRDDLIVGSQAGQSIVLLQPEKLLDRLTEQWKVTVERWQKSGHTVLWRGRVSGNRNEYLQTMFRHAREAQEPTILTGLDACLIEAHIASEPTRYLHIASEPTRYLYAARLGKLLEGLEVQETRRFPNLEILTPPDEAVFFDSRVLAGIRWPSQLQSYLELMTDDARLRQGAEEMRKVMLKIVEQQKAEQLNAGDKK